MLRLVLATLVALLCLAAPASADLPVLSAEPDGTRGGRIVDAHGREMLLRGAELPPSANLRVLQATGWNVVRVRLGLDPASLTRTERAVDALADAGIYSVLALPAAIPPLVDLNAVVQRFALRGSVAGFEGLPIPGKLLFNPAPLPSRSLVLTPSVTSPDGLEAARQRANGAPLVVWWPMGPDAVRHQDAQNGLRISSIVTDTGAPDPKGPLARAYVRAAPGALAFSHYEEQGGHFAARGTAPAGNRVPVELFYPQSKHAGARIKAKGLAGVRAHRLAGGARLVYGVPRGRWSVQIGPRVKR
jgi:hypothetical protein